MSKISEYAAIGSVQSDDLLVVVDTHDTSMAPSGTTKKMTVSQLAVPWQFLPESYGAKGDGKVLGDCSITSGQAVLSSASYSFTSGDAGKHVMLNGGNGTAAAPLITTISSVSGGNATLAASASQTMPGNGACVFGTDDTAALAACEAAAGSYALAGEYFAQVYYRNIYIAASGPTQTTSPATQNSQIPMPYPAVSGATRKLVIEHAGPAPSGHCEFFESAVPNVLPGSIVSMLTKNNTVDPTFGYQSVIGGPAGGGAFTGSCANMKASFRNVTIWTPIFTNLMGADMGYIGGCHWEESAVKVFAPAAAGVQPYISDLPPLGGFQSTTGVGIRFPLVGNNDDVTVIRAATEGFETHLWVADHFECNGLATIYSDLAVLVDLVHGISGDAHGVTIRNWSCEAYNGALKCNGGGSGYCAVDIFLDTETVGGSDPSYDVNDNGNLHGIIRISDNGARTNRRPVIANGAPNLKVVNDMMGPGHWASPPSVPATTVAQQNTAWRDATVYITSGGAAVSAIAVDGTATGLTLGTSGAVAVRVPSGKDVTLTYASTAPTWVWVLD